RQRRVAAVQPLAHGDDVGYDGSAVARSKVFEGEELSGATGAAQHFIGDEQNAVRVAELADARVVAGRRYRRSGGRTADGFRDEGRDVFRTDAFQRLRER